MTAEAYRCLHEDVLPALEREGIVLRGLKDLTDADTRPPAAASSSARSSRC